MRFLNPAENFLKILAAPTLGLAICVVLGGGGGRVDAVGLASREATLTFGPERRLGRDYKNPSTPFLRYSPEGRLYAIWTEVDLSQTALSRRGAPYGDPSAIRAAFLAWSADGGQRWSEPRQVNDSVERVQEDESGPRLAFGGNGRVYAVWSVTAKTGIILQGNVRFAVMDGNGFTAASTLNEVEGSARFPVIEAAADGSVFVVWVDRRIDIPKPRQLYSVQLGPDGKPLTKDYQVGEGLCECCHIGMALADDSSTVYVASRDVSPERIRDPALRKSTDGGASFGRPVTISNDGWMMPACPASGPTIVRDDLGHLHVTWFTLGRSAEKEGGVYYAVSKDGGRSFSARQLVQGDAQALLHTTLAVGKDGTVYFAWDNLDSSSRSQVFVRTLGSGGNWGPTQQVSRARRNAMRPAVAVSAKYLHVAWTETLGERSWIVLRSARLVE